MDCTFLDGDPWDEGIKISKSEILATHSTVGVCSQCTNVAPLILNLVFAPITTNKTSIHKVPNGLNATLHRSSSLLLTAQTRTKNNLTWAGDLLGPTHRASSRWAYANTTFLAADQYRRYYECNKTDIFWGDYSVPEPYRSIVLGPANIIAAACNLYPCLRTYIASLSSTELQQKEVLPEPIQIELFGNISSLVWLSLSLMWWSFQINLSSKRTFGIFWDCLHVFNQLSFSTSDFSRERRALVRLVRFKHRLSSASE